MRIFPHRFFSWFADYLSPQNGLSDLSEGLLHHAARAADVHADKPLALHIAEGVAVV